MWMIRLIFPSSSVPPFVRISALPSTVAIFFHCDPRNGIACREGTAREQRCNCTLSLTPALDGVEGHRHAPAALPPVTDPVPTVQQVGVAPQPVRTGEEHPPPPTQGFDPRTVQPAASRYTDSYRGPLHKCYEA
jgi:hypothetical protein